MALFVFNCRNPACDEVKVVPIEAIPEAFWEGGYRNPGFFDQTCCASCGSDRPQVQVQASAATPVRFA